MTCFIPPFYLRGTMLQTFLGSNRAGGIRPNAMSASARSLTLTTEKDVRLVGALSLADTKEARGLVILLHGWEGSIASTYIVSTGRYLFDRGYNIFRLNFRDHGNTHQLNKGLFYAAQLDEVYSAVLQATRLARGLPVYLCGFSLGGNFALRIAERCSRLPKKNTPLKHVIAISPVLDPSRATDAIDDRPSIRRYFLKKWRCSLSIKQRFFPELYDFTDVITLTSIRQMTEKLLTRYSSYQNADEYFADYTLKNNDLQTINIPSTLIMSKDDPVIPIADFYKLSPNKNVRLIIHKHGGHNGFVKTLFGRTWYEEYMANTFSGKPLTPDCAVASSIT